jgi:low affinity Fe/Cu permease
LKQGFKSNSGKEIKDAIDKLVKEGIVIVEKKTKEEHVCLNTNKVKLIHKIVDWFTDHVKEINKEELNKTYLEIENE